MEKKFKRIPFDLELAKSIIKGKKEGRVVTNWDSPVRILCFDKVDDKTPIVALFTHQPTQSECLCQFDVNGVERDEHLIKLVLEVPEDEQEFKEGDVVGYSEGESIIGIYKSDYDKYNIDVFCCVEKRHRVNFYPSFYLNKENMRLATEDEKQQLIDALKKDGSGKAKEYLIRFFGTKMPYTFKAGEEVLIRGSKREAWDYTLYNRPHSKGLHLVVGHLEAIYDCHILPYNEQTKHLLGTTDDLEE